jgi:hypothetical protein
MGITQPPTRGTQRVYGRGSLLSILEKDVILTGIRVFIDGRFIVETKNWDEYWKSAKELGYEKVEDNLGTLYSAWCDYIRSGFNAGLRQHLCHRYFSLLDTLLALRVIWSKKGINSPFSGEQIW